MNPNRGTRHWAWLMAPLLLLGGCGDPSEAPSEQRAAPPEAAASSELPAPAPAVAVEFELNLAPPPAPAPEPRFALAIAPLFNPSLQPVHLNELLREYTRLFIGGAFEASSGEAVVPSARVDAAFARRQIDPRSSVSDEALLEIARELAAPLLLSVEPYQDDDLALHLRVRLASLAEGQITVREEFDGADRLALYVSFLNLYMAHAREITEVALEAAGHPPALFGEERNTSPTLERARGLGALALGDGVSRSVEQVLRNPGDARTWSILSRDYSRLSASLRAPSRAKKRLGARALAAANLAKAAEPGANSARQASAFANWANHLTTRAEMDLSAISPPEELDAEGKILKLLLAGDEPTPESGLGAAPRPDGGSAQDLGFESRLRAMQAAAWWSDDEALGLLSDSADPWDPASAWERAGILVPGQAQNEAAGLAASRAALIYLLAALENAWRQGADLRSAFERLYQLDRVWAQGIQAALEEKTRGGAPQGYGPELARKIAADSAIEFDLQAFARGEGKVAALLSLAAEIAPAADPARLDPGRLLSWTGSDRLALAEALAIDAWLGAWGLCGSGLGDSALDEKAFGFAKRVFPSSAPILAAEAEYFDSVNFDSAKRNQALSAARAADPGYSPAARRGAWAREIAMEDPRRAIAVYERVRAMDPFNTRLACWAASNMARLGEVGRARTMYQSAIRSARHDSRPFLGLLDIYSKLELRRVDSGMIAEMLTHYSQTPALRLEAARLYFESGESGRAENIASALVKSHPSRWEPASLLARIQAYQGGAQGMKGTIDLFLSSEPAREIAIQALEMKGDLFLRAGKPAEAQQAYESALELSPDSASLLFGLASAQKESGKTEAAIDAFLRQAETGGDTEGVKQAGLILLESDGAERALPLARQAQRDHPASPGGYELESEILRRAGDTQGALDVIGRLKEKAPRNPAAFMARARVYRSVGQSSQAVETALDGLARRSERFRADLREVLIRALLDEGKTDEAQAQARRLEAMRFDDPDTLALAAEAYIGQEVEAAKRIKIVLRMNPLHAEALRIESLLKQSAN